jgi:hypothetical protein
MALFTVVYLAVERGLKAAACSAARPRKIVEYNVSFIIILTRE